MRSKEKEKKEEKEEKEKAEEEENLLMEMSCRRLGLDNQLSSVMVICFQPFLPGYLSVYLPPALPNYLLIFSTCFLFFSCLYLLPVIVALSFQYLSTCFLSFFHTPPLLSSLLFFPFFIYCSSSYSCSFLFVYSSSSLYVAHFLACLLVSCPQSPIIVSIY